MAKKNVSVEEQSPKFKFNKTDMSKLGKSFLLALVGFVIAFLADMIPQVDFGQWSELVYVMTPVILNIGRKWIKDNK